MPAKHGRNQGRSKHANATTWRPGQSGNPAGRPPVGMSIAERLRAFLDQPDAKRKGTRLDAILSMLYELAVSGNVSAIRTIMDRAFGRVEGDTPQTGDSARPGEPNFFVFLREDAETAEKYRGWLRENTVLDTPLALSESTE